MGGLTKIQKEVLEAMRERGIYKPDGSAVTSTETFYDGYTLFIHWRTASALERKGLVKIHDQVGGLDGYDVMLVGEPA